MSLQSGKKSAISNHRRPFLWFLLFIQFILIIIFMIFSGGYSINNNSDENGLNFEREVNSVKFIGNNYETSGRQKNEPGSQNGLDLNRKRKFNFNLKNFTEQFYIVSSLDVSNDTIAVDEDVYCNRDGTETYQNSIIDNELQSKCICSPEWHGKDCGLPEVLWRSFMTSKIPIRLSPPRKIPHTIFYLIQTTGISIETLDIQVMELQDLVEIFILCDLKFTKIFYKNYFIKNHVHNTTSAASQRSSVGILDLFQRNRIILFDDRKCTPKIVYKKIKLIFGEMMKDDDVIMFSKSDEIVNKKAIAYFKWYDNWPQPVHFRLKYTVYGFYWQHPDSTRLGSVVSQLRTFEDLYKSDPERMQVTKRPGIIVGDLNHYGGWYCQYCYQPIDIVQRLAYDHQIIKFNYKQVIDSNFVENLISNGLYVDGKMHLVKLHRYSEKYFAPTYVTVNSMNFDNILTNIFAKWDDNGDDYIFD